MDTNQTNKTDDKPLGQVGSSPDDDVLKESGSLEYNGDSSEPDATGTPSNATSKPQPITSNDASSATDESSGKSDTVDATGGKAKAKKAHGKLWRFWQHFNVYLVIFAFLVVIAVVTSLIIYLRSKSTTVTPAGSISKQNLPSETLQALAKNGIQVGDPKQVLNIQSNSVFNGAVLVKGELQVAGGLRIGSGSLTLSDLNVANQATFNQLQMQSLGVSGTARVNDLSVLRNVSVNGSGTFNGGLTSPSLSVGKLQVNGDLSIPRHLVASGASPGRSSGGALGSGGTSTVGGSDTAGSISINTGNGPAAGCFITVNFVNAFDGSPHVVVTPVGSAAAGLNYYINRSSSNFSVCATNSAPANSSFGFDYHVFN